MTDKLLSKDELAAIVSTIRYVIKQYQEKDSEAIPITITYIEKLLAHIEAMEERVNVLETCFKYLKADLLRADTPNRERMIGAVWNAIGVALEGKPFGEFNQSALPEEIERLRDGN